MTEWEGYGRRIWHGNNVVLLTRTGLRVGPVPLRNRDLGVLYFVRWICL